MAIDRVLTGSGTSVIAPATRQEEVALVRAALGGDKTAFETLVRRYQNAVSAVAYALIGRFNLSEDVAQETFLQAWSRLNEIREPECFGKWLLTIARRVSSRALRGQQAALKRTDLGVEAGAIPSSEPSPLDRAISREEEEFLWRALRKIPESLRLPLVLFYREKKSPEAVAAMLDLSHSNVRMRLVRGRRLLQQHVAELIESVLTRTRVEKAFTAAVLAALAAARPASAATPRHPIESFVLGRFLPSRSLVGAAVVVVAAAVWYQRHDVPSRDAAAYPGKLPAVATAMPRSPPKFEASFLAGGTAGGGKNDPQSSPRAGSRVLSFDFEDELLPEAFFFGHVVPGPPRPGNRFAAMASVSLYGTPPVNTVAFAMEDVHYRDTLLLKLDYWMPVAGNDWIKLQIRNDDRGCNYFHRIDRVVRGRWTSVAVRSSDFLGEGKCSASEPMQTGDRLDNVKIIGMGGAFGKPSFFVDNLALVDDTAAGL